MPTTDELGHPAGVTAGPVSIDRTKPRLTVSGARNGATYPKARKLACKATDTLSGVASCKVTSRRSKVAKGTLVTWTAVATDRAGNPTTTKGRYTIATRH